jgi:hypothetical protein
MATSRSSAKISRRPTIVEEKPEKSSRSSTLSSRHRPLRYWRVEEERFELDARYTVTDFMGQGAYGVVMYVMSMMDGDAFMLLFVGV